MLMLGVAVEAYYLAGVVWLGDDPGIVTSPVAHHWLILSVLVGTTLGVAGSWAAGRSALLAVVGTGVLILVASLRRPLVALGATVLAAPLTAAAATCFVGSGVWM